MSNIAAQCAAVYPTRKAANSIGTHSARPGGGSREAAAGIAIDEGGNESDVKAKHVGNVLGLDVV